MKNLHDLSRFLLVIFSVSWIGASFADSMYLDVVGQKSAHIDGGVTTRGYEKTIAVSGFEHELSSPRDPQSGLPTGQRQHQPLTLTIALDRSYPLLYNVLTTNENISKLTVRGIVTKSPMTEGGTWKLELTNANIADIRKYTEQIKAGGPFRTLLRISFAYQKIQWTWGDGGTTVTDDWKSRL